ncbi:Hypothetical_protein [Hexamita inflata]|uniref:Hypothetical_protein n=1 Tax=Hexamita inflata TaxID=28002 RepID=A0AA86N690_9EUKA|nr:Hypothetical protein HINF_LOCUS1161 [Hexamita inflata]
MSMKNIVIRKQGKRSAKTANRKVVPKAKPKQNQQKQKKQASKARISLQKTTIDMYLRHLSNITLDQLNTLMQQKITKKQKQLVKEQIIKIEEKSLSRQVVRQN